MSYRFDNNLLHRNTEDTRCVEDWKNMYWDQNHKCVRFKKSFEDINYKYERLLKKFEIINSGNSLISELLDVKNENTRLLEKYDNIQKQLIKEKHLHKKRYAELENKYNNLEINHKSKQEIIIQNDLWLQEQKFNGKVIKKNNNYGFIKSKMFVNNIYFSDIENKINNMQNIEFRLVKNVSKNKFEAEIIKKK